MGLATFKGGIHPYEGKELSMSKPVSVLQPKGEMVFPLSQHIGARLSHLWQRATMYWLDRRSVSRADLYRPASSAPFPEQ